jgi:hypothetical protein
MERLVPAARNLPAKRNRLERRTAAQASPVGTMLIEDWG